jgi:hypothetical protein
MKYGRVEKSTLCGRVRAFGPSERAYAPLQMDYANRASFSFASLETGAFFVKLRSVTRAINSVSIKDCKRVVPTRTSQSRGGVC